MSMSDDPTTDDPLQIDRLVDGELDPAERHALLVRLETEPGGWRRCALAFLEAQSWREALAPLVVGSASGGTSRTSAAPVKQSSAPGPGLARRWRPMAAVAAGWLAALALGWIAGGGTSTSRPGSTPGGPLAETPGVSTNAGPLVPPGTRPDRSEIVSAEPAPSPDEDRPSTAPSLTPRRPPTLVAIPVLGARRLRQAPPPVPEPVRRNLERWGFQVEPRHGLMSVKLRDGRHVAVPVDAVKMRYVGTRRL